MRHRRTDADPPDSSRLRERGEVRVAADAAGTGFTIPFLVLPVPVYLFFGVILPAAVIAKNPSVANYLFSGFSVFAVMGPALFGVGCALALERDAGFLKLKRALPAPGGAYLIAKMVMAMVFGAVAMILLVVAATSPARSRSRHHSSSSWLSSW